MKAVVCHESALTVEELPDPVPGPGQILIEVTRCGICGSDLHMRNHGDVIADMSELIGLDGIMRLRDRVVMGHEFSGRVLEYGPKTRKHWKKGQLVVALPMVRTDGVAGMTGLAANAPGGYAEKVVVQESLTFPVPDKVSADAAAMTEPLAVAWHAVRRGKVGKGETAVVIGCGPIGLAVILMLKAHGVKTVIAAVSSRCGAAPTWSSTRRRPRRGSTSRRPSTSPMRRSCSAQPSTPWSSCARSRCSPGTG